jgi:hypothetical protein
MTVMIFASVRTGDRFFVVSVAGQTPALNGGLYKF